MQSLNQALLKFQNLNLEITKNSKAQITDRAYYSYADLPHVLEMVKPQLSACGLLLVQTTTTNESGTTELITKVVHAESGEQIESSLPIYVDEKPQNFGSRLTYWRRYAILTVLNLSPDDDDAGELQQSYQPPSRQQPSSPQRQYAPRDDESHQSANACPNCGSELTPSRNGGKPYCRPCWQASKQGGR